MKKLILVCGCLLSTFTYGVESQSNQSTQQQPTLNEEESPAHHDMMQAMANMCTDMSAMEMSGDLSKDFVMMMITHHQSAVEMASAYLTEGTDPVLVAMASKIIEAQEKEIQELQNWLSTHKNVRSSQLSN